MSRKKKKGSSGHSSLADHERRGKTLTPPLVKVKPQPQSWRDDRLPEMLWAALLVTQVDREHALEIFRNVGRLILSLRDDDPPSQVTHTNLATLNSDRLQMFLKAIVEDDECKLALQPLLLFSSLPARTAWESVLGDNPSPDCWGDLMITIAKTLDHQSQESTDCRWLSALSMILAGKLTMPKEILEEILGYPDVGDMRQVRPTIRATEGVFPALQAMDTIWSKDFWAECLKDTACFPLPSKSSMPINVGTTAEQARQVYILLVQHYHDTISTTAIDARHETVFASSLYCLAVLQELLRVGASHGINARLALRTIAECLITLTYLAQKDQPDLWRSYRVFGAGQAKLQYLKLDELDHSPSYVSADSLQQLANEDIWEELLEIDLGHWANSDLRKLSIEAGAKGIYDSFYAWTSSFAHGHWGSVRDSVFDTCGNPLHRLHRIPRTTPRLLPDVLPDACQLIDAILSVLSKCYPDFPHRVTTSG